jgi:predicted exporter
MPAKEHDAAAAKLLADLHPFAEQAARILSYLSNVPEAISSSDQELAARIGHVSAQHVSLVMRALVEAGLAAQNRFTAQLSTSPETLARFAYNLQGISIYLRSHRDADAVRLVLTEPGDHSALRSEINRRGLPPRLFQTRDAFLNLAHNATSGFTVLDDRFHDFDQLEGILHGRDPR